MTAIPPRSPKSTRRPHRAAGSASRIAIVALAGITLLILIAIASAQFLPALGGSASEEGAVANAAGKDAAQNPAAQDPLAVPARGEQIVVGYSDEPSTLLGPFATSDAEINISSLLFPWLTNLELHGELKHVPGMASRWERSADGMSITYFLKDAKWDDGRPVQASDVLFTFQLVSNKEFGSSRFEYTKKVKSVEAVDAKTVKFTFANAYYVDNQMSDVNVGILPEHIYKKMTAKEVRGSDLAMTPVGHGPFRMVSRQGARLFVLERNEQCVTTRVPLLKRAVFYYTATPDAAKNAILAGETDAMDTSRIEDAADILAKGGYYTISRGLRGVDFVTWNHKNPLFADRAVRRALTMAIDRDGINNSVFRVKSPGVFAQPVGTIPPVLERAVPRDLAPLVFDRKAAAAALDAAGWKRGSDGIREKAGVKFKFTLLVNSETPRRVQTARMVLQDLREAGIEAVMDEVSWPALNKRMNAREFDAAIYGFSTSLQLKQGEVWSSEAPFNFSSYKNPAADEIINKMREEEEPEKLRASLIELQKIVYEDQPVTFVSWYSRVAVVRERFRNFGADILAFVGGIDKCYVPASLQVKFKGE